MNLQPRAVILLAIDAFGGRVAGKTLLQKRLYFTEILARESLALGFNAHFYGPYSAVINSEVSTLKLQGQVREDSSVYGFSATTGFEIRRYSYDLTDEGRKSVKWLRTNYQPDSTRVSEAAERVLDAGNLDYMELSFAAKAHWILRHSHKQLSSNDISNEAARFGWSVQPEQVERGIAFLRKLDLVSPSLPSSP